MIYRSHPSTHYTTIPNALLQDLDISDQARGLLIRVLSYHPGKRITEKGMVTKHNGLSSVKRCIGELITAGYVLRNLERNEKGHLQWVTHFFDVVQDVVSEETEASSATAMALPESQESQELDSVDMYSLDNIEALFGNRGLGVELAKEFWDYNEMRNWAGVYKIDKAIDLFMDNPRRQNKNKGVVLMTFDEAVSAFDKMNVKGVMTDYFELVPQAEGKPKWCRKL